MRLKVELDSSLLLSASGLNWENPHFRDLEAKAIT